MTNQEAYRQDGFDERCINRDGCVICAGTGSDHYWLYVLTTVEWTGRCKIGISSNMSARFDQLNQSSCFGLRVVHTVQMCCSVQARRLESYLHRCYADRLAPDTVGREWFVLSESDLKHLVEVLSALPGKDVVGTIERGLFNNDSPTLAYDLPSKVSDWKILFHLWRCGRSRLGRRDLRKIIRRQTSVYSAAQYRKREEYDLDDLKQDIKRLQSVGLVCLNNTRHRDDRVNHRVFGLTAAGKDLIAWKRVQPIDIEVVDTGYRYTCRSCRRSYSPSGTAKPEIVVAVCRIDYVCSCCDNPPDLTFCLDCAEGCDFAFAAGEHFLKE